MIVPSGWKRVHAINRIQKLLLYLPMIFQLSYLNDIQSNTFHSGNHLVKIGIWRSLDAKQLSEILCLVGNRPDGSNGSRFAIKAKGSVIESWSGDIMTQLEKILFELHMCFLYIVL